MSRFRFPPVAFTAGEMAPDVLSPVLFGKMPSRADFVRRGGPSPAIEALDALNQRALGSPLAARTGPLYRLVAVPPRGPHVLVGALGLSRDTVGRVYPLVTGRTARRQVADAAVLPAWPLRWGELLDSAAALVTASAAGATLEWLEPPLARLPAVALPQGPSAEVDAHVRRLHALPAHTLWSRTWGSPDAERFALIVSRLLKVTGRAVPYGLRFCLPQPAPDFLPADAVATCLAVCWYLLPRPVPPPTLLWTGGPPAALYIFFSDIAAPSFRAVLTGTPHPDRIAAVDDGTASARVRAIASLPQDIRAVLEDERASVADVLDALHTLR